MKNLKFFFCRVFFKILSKFSDFINFDDKVYQNVSSFYSKKDLNLIKIEIISSEKMRNSGNYNYDYAHSFFGNNF